MSVISRILEVTILSLAKIRQRLDALLVAVQNIDIDTSTLAKQGTNESATLTATQTAATNAYASAEAAKTAIGTPASGQPSTLFAAIAASGGGPATALEAEVEQGKADIAQAIEGKGGTASASQSMQQLATAITNLPTIGMGTRLVWADGVTITSVKQALNESRASLVEYEDYDLTSIINAGFFAYMSGLKRVVLHNLTAIDTPLVVNLFAGVTADFIGAPKLLTFRSSNFNGAAGAKEIYFPKLTSVYRQMFRNNTLIEKVNLHNCNATTDSQTYNYTFNNCSNLKWLDLTSATNDVIYASSSGGKSTFGSCINLIDLIIGTNLSDGAELVSWDPTNALSSSTTSLLTDTDIAAGFTSNLEKLLYNIREHIAALLPDRTGDTAYTIQFSANVKAAILADAATLTAFTNKNWTIA